MREETEQFTFFFFLPFPECTTALYETKKRVPRFFQFMRILYQFLITGRNK